MTITIRQAKIEDARCIAEAEQEIAQEPGYFCSLPSELSEQKVQQTIESLEGIYLVAEKEGQIVGHAFLELLHLQSIRHVAELNICVHKGYQEKSIGTKLMEKLIEWAKQSAVVEKIELNVRATNSRAIALYKKMGFHEEGRLKRRVKAESRYLDGVLMALHVQRAPPYILSPRPVIRALQESDIKLLSDLYFPWTSREETLKKWSRYLQEQSQGGRIALIIEYHGQIAGYANLLRQSEYPPFKLKGIPEINDLWIYDEHRKKGLGTLLVTHFEDLASSQGYTEVGIGVGLYRDYGQAQRLYFRLGYRPNGEGISYKHIPVTAGEFYPVDDDLVLWLTKNLLL